MTLQLTLLAFAAATSCGLDSKIDPDDICKLSTKEWGNLDADSVPATAESKISLTIDTKDSNVDIFGFEHGATVGSLSDKANNRYILACPQVEGTDDSPNKTVKFTIHRPADMTELGSEWVKLYPKDSWTNVTNEYEPWTVNKYGAKIPVLRHTPEGEDPPNPDKEDSITVYMEVSDIGDYEVKYGNPKILTYPSDGGLGRWVAVEFKSTLLRVGSPWAQCSEEDALAEDTVSVGTIIPALFGHPNLNLEAYEDFTDEITATDLGDVVVVLEIFADGISSYTMSEAGARSEKTVHPSGDDYTMCYEAGNACPEGHSVCKAKYCELDTFEAIIKGLKTAGAKVLGVVGPGVTEADYDLLDEKVDGFFFNDATTISTLSGADATSDSLFKVASTGEPLFDKNKVSEADTYVTLSLDDLGVWNPYSWYPHVANKKWAAIVDKVAAAKTDEVVDTLVDRGYGYIFVTDQDGFKTASSYNADLFAKLGAKMTARRLEGRRLSETTYSYGCDDTLFECNPVCLAQSGPVTTIVDNTLCADEPMDMCKCKCYYDAQWSCQDEAVVCKATKGIETMVVGDLVCENRGSPKPACEETPMPTTRGSFPTEQCLATWATTVAPEVTTKEPTTQAPATQAPATQTPEEPTAKPDEDEEEAEAEASTVPPAGENEELVIVLDSFSMVAALSLVALQ